MNTTASLGQLMRDIEAMTKPKRKGKKAKESRIVESVRVLEEVQKEGEGHVFKVVLITEGLGNLRNKNYYGPDAIASAVEMFEGKPAFIDHPSESEEADIPERRVKAKCGYFKGLHEGKVMDRKTKRMVRACLGEFHTDLSESGELAYKKGITALHYQKEFPNSTDVYVGFSVNGDGEAERRTLTTEHGEMSVNYVTRFTEGASCDLVTEPARGGGFIALVESMTGAGKEARMRLKKMIESALAALKGATAEKDEATKATKLAEAQKQVEKAIEAADNPGYAESADAMCAKREGESDEDHQSRLHGLAAALKKHLGAASDAADDATNADADGDEPDADDAPAKDMESARAAVKHLLAEAKIPADAYSADGIERLAKMKFSEAKREVSEKATFAESIRKNTLKAVESRIPSLSGFTRESEGNKDGSKAFAARFKD
jgi:hypothetical protein